MTDSKAKIRFIILAVIFIFSGGCPELTSSITSQPSQPDYRQLMREFIENISQYARKNNRNFIIIPQNGHELLLKNDKPDYEYIKAIDGIGREDLFFGYEQDNKPTPANERNEMIKFLNIAKNRNLKILVTDYCSTHENIDISYSQNAIHGYISFAADSRELNDIPEYPAQPYNVNKNDINTLSNAQNFLYLINPYPAWKNKDDFIKTLKATDYDILIIDAFFDKYQLTRQDISQLRKKANGGRRLVIAYMSIGEAEDYRYYWQADWKKTPPDWLEAENPEWKGNYKVRYWKPSWQKIIYGQNNSYLDKIISASFDGVYLDIIDAYEFFEENP